MADPAFDTPAGPVVCRGMTPRLLSHFRTQAPEWPLSDDRDAIGTVSVVPDEGGWRFRSSGYDAPDFRFEDGLGAGNGLVGCLIHTFVAASDSWMAFHAAAVETEGGLTVLAGDMMAGKSTISAAMVAQGHQLWCDDRLPVSANGQGFDGMSLALRPKLRLPLPPSATVDFETFVRQRSGPDEGSMQYLLLGGVEAAGFGDRLPIRRVVVLERDGDAGAPEVRPLALGEAVKRLAACAFAPHLGPVGLLERLRAIVQSCECLVLSYSDSFEAARFARDTWGTGR